MQPGQPVGALDPDDVAVGEVDEPLAGLQRALLEVERAVVRRHAERRCRRRRRPRAGPAAGCGHSQFSHLPKTVRWPTSTVNPCSARSRSPQRGEHLWVNGHDAVTIPADQVEVLVVAHRVVGRGPVAEVGVADQAELLEHLERAVDRRDVDRRGLLPAPGPAPRRGWRARAPRPRAGSARAGASAGSHCPGASRASRWSWNHSCAPGAAGNHEPAPPDRGATRHGRAGPSAACRVGVDHPARPSPRSLRDGAQPRSSAGLQV